MIEGGVVKQSKWKTILFSIKPWDRHALTLIVSGIVYSTLGIITIIRPTNPPDIDGLDWIYSHIPDVGWGVCFFAIGLLTTLSSRWPAISKPVGYSLLTGWAALWSGFNFFGGIFEGDVEYVVRGLMWGNIAFLWWVISGFVTIPKARLTCGYTPSYSFSIGGVDRSNLCLRDAEKSIERSKREYDNESSDVDGKRGL